MKNQIFAILALALSTAVMAEPVLYICERPTWGNDEGCGPNKTRYSYAFLIDSEDFGAEATGVDSDKLTRANVWAETRGCDLSRAPGKEGKYLVTDKGFLFILSGRGGYGREVELHTDSMQAKILGASVKKSPYMSCIEYSGDAAQAPTVPQFYSQFPRPSERAQPPTGPTVNVNSSRQQQ